MKFCAGCDKPLDFQEFLDGDLCSACRRKEQAASQPPAAEEPAVDELLDTTLTLTGTRIELRAPEGWILWSGGPGETHELRSILTGAQKILSIRRKREKKK